MPNYHSFDRVKTIPNKRTKLDSLSYEKKMTLNEGDLRPCYLQEVLPGMMIHLRDAVSIKNIPSPLHAVIDDAYLDISYFFVPRRLLWKDWESFIGADATPDAYTDPKSYQEPVISSAPSGYAYPGIGSASILNDLGVGAVGSVSVEISPFPLAAVALIWNEFYRDENYQDENPFPAQVFALESGDVITIDSSNYNSLKWALSYEQVAFNSVNKYHDLFTSVLPKPQKAPNPVSIPLGTTAPVTVRTGSRLVKGGIVNESGSAFTANNVEMDDMVAGGYDNAGLKVGGTYLINPAIPTQNIASGLEVDLANAVSADINALRLAFAAQAYLEALARGGSRYTELLHQMFGVSPSDARLQRPEFLGTVHQRLSFTSVASTNGNGSNTPSSSQRPTGSLGGYSVTGLDRDVFFKQFEEHGYVIGLASIRVRHTYGQGVPKIFLKKDRFDYWSKYFDRIGEVPVQTKEIYAGADASDVLGFQEAWHEYKFHQDEISGGIAPGNGGGSDLQAWTYSDYYTQKPVASSDFLRETKDNIQRTLISTAAIPQYVLDFFHQVTAVVPLSVNSVPAGIGF